MILLILMPRNSWTNIKCPTVSFTPLKPLDEAQSRSFARRVEALPAGTKNLVWRPTSSNFPQAGSRCYYSHFWFSNFTKALGVISLPSGPRCSDQLGSKSSSSRDTSVSVASGWGSAMDPGMRSRPAYSEANRKHRAKMENPPSMCILSNLLALLVLDPHMPSQHNIASHSYINEGVGGFLMPTWEVWKETCCSCGWFGWNFSGKSNLEANHAKPFDWKGKEPIASVASTNLGSPCELLGSFSWDGGKGSGTPKLVARCVKVRWRIWRWDEGHLHHKFTIYISRMAWCLLGITLLGKGPLKGPLLKCMHSWKVPEKAVRADPSDKDKSPKLLHSCCAHQTQ